MSKRSSLLSARRYSRDGFQQIPEPKSSKMTNPNDATIDIPLTTVTTNTGTRPSNSSPVSPSQQNEKTGLFKRQAGGRRRKVYAKDTSNHEEDGSLTRMGLIYDKILNFSIVTRYFLYVLPLALILMVPIVIGATVARDAVVGRGPINPQTGKQSFSGVRIVWLFTWIEIVWLSLWVSKLAAKSLPFIFQFLCGIVSSGTRKYAMVLEALEIPLSLVGWALASLATWKPLMTQNPDQRGNLETTATDWEDIMGNVLGAILFSALVYLGEKLLVQLISISYHRKQFDLKIKTSKRNIYLLSLLYEASTKMFPAYCPEFADEDYIINDSIGLPISKGGSSHNRSGSATPMRLLQNVGRVGDKITAAFGNIAHEVTGKEVFNPTSAHSVVVEALEKQTSSEALAKRIWMSCVVEGRDALYLDDLVEVLGQIVHENEAEECFNSLDRDGNSDISLDEMILTVCEFGRDRTSIASSLHDVDQAINVLDNLLCLIVFLICLFIFVAFLNSSLNTTLATAGTALLSLSFVFATTAQEVLGSCIFLFVKHPFDVGDRVDIGDEQLVVERISLLFTVFKRIKTHKTTQVPNIVLNSNWIDNVTRSEAMREQLLMYISFDTSLEDIQILRNEMQRFVLDKENARDFQPEIEVEVTGIAEMNKMELKVEIKHKSNWSNEAVRAARRSKFMCALVLALRKVPIYAPGGGYAGLGSADAPTYSVSVSDAEAIERRAAFAQSKEEQRLVPTKKPEARTPSPGKSPFTAKSSGTGPPLSAASVVRNRTRSPTMNSITSPTPETVALATLNARNPASDPAHEWQTDSPTDRRRSNDIEEVRDMLRRQSTQGKRKQRDSILSPKKIPGSNVPTIAEPSPNVYREYGAYDGTVIIEPTTPGLSLPLQGTNESLALHSNPYQPQKDFSQPPTTPPKVVQQQYQQRSRAPTVSTNPFMQQERESPMLRPLKQGQGRNIGNSFVQELP